MKFNKVKYDNQFQKENYDRIALNVKKGQREIIKNYALAKGYASVNNYIVDLIYKDMGENNH